MEGKEVIEIENLQVLFHNTRCSLSLSLFVFSLTIVKLRMVSGGEVPSIGLILTNIHTSAVTVEVELVSDTANRGGANNVANGTSFLVKDVTIPAGSSLELLSGGKVVLETTDEIKIDCSVADKVSGTLSIMEIT